MAQSRWAGLKVHGITCAKRIGAALSTACVQPMLPVMLACSKAMASPQVHRALLCQRTCMTSLYRLELLSLATAVRSS